MTFTVDWFSNHITTWEEKVLPKITEPNPRYLEIGSYEGKSLLWMLDRVPNLSAYSIDPHSDGSWETFSSNVQGRAIIFRERSEKALKNLVLPDFNAVYIDGSHWAHDVLSDSVLSWPLLKTGGVMIWDDYGWLVEDDPIKGPKAAIDAFLTCYRTQYKVLHIGYQFMVEKL